MGTLQENQSLNAEYERNKKEQELLGEVERLNNIIKEVIKLIEADYFEDGSGENIEKVLEILKGSEQE